MEKSPYPAAPSRCTAIGTNTIPRTPFTRFTAHTAETFFRNTRMENRLPLPVWVGAVVSAWTFLVLAADLKTAIHPNIHWLITVLAVTCALPYLLRLRMPPLRTIPGLAPAALLVLAVLLAGFASPDPLYAIAEAAKLAIILLAARALFIAEPELAHYAQIGRAHV